MENPEVEKIAFLMWYNYCVRVSGKTWADKQPWADVDSQTRDVFLGHAIVAHGMNAEVMVENKKLRSELDQLQKAAEAKSRKLSAALTKPVTIRGVTYQSKEAAAEALGVKPGTIKGAKANGRLDTVGNGKGSNWNDPAQRKKNVEKRTSTIEFEGSSFRGWKEATHITGLSRKTMLRRGAVVY